jgi:hypothetical protein
MAPGTVNNIPNMQGYEVCQPYKTTDASAIKSRSPLWGILPRLPNEVERAYLSEAAMRRYLEPQPGAGLEFEPRLVITKKRAILIGSLPVVYYRRKVEDIDLLPQEISDDLEFSVSQ